MFKSPFSFEGRIRRTEYCLSYLIYVIALSIFSELSEAESAPFILVIVVIPLVWFFFAQGAKRCHDRGNTGWFQIIPFYMLWMMFAASDYGENEYGPNPKGLGNYAEIDEIGKDMVK